MYVIGGSSFTSDSNCQKLRRLDVSSLQWEAIGTTAKRADAIPESLDEHTATLDDNRTIVVFGGFNDGTRANNVHTIDLETREWNILDPATCDKPTPRAGHSASIHNGCLYIFGGKDDENEKLNDLWRFDIATRTWTELIVEEPHTVPTQRSGHSSIVFGDYICIFGGILEITKELNDVLLYDISNNKWITLFGEKVQQVSGSPTKSSYSLSQSSPLMRRNTKRGMMDPSSPTMGGSIGKQDSTGGARRNNFAANNQPLKIKVEETKKKVEKEVVLDSPTSVEMLKSFLIQRADPSFDVMAQIKRKKNSFGFGVNYNAFGLNMALSQRGKSRVSGIRPMPRDGHTGILADNYMIVFGGDRHHMPFNDMFALDLAAEMDKQASRLRGGSVLLDDSSAAMADPDLARD